MRKATLFSVVLLCAGSLLAADSIAKNEVSAAAKKLGSQTNYTWKTTIVVPNDAQFKPGPVEGKTEKDGFSDVKMSFFGNEIEVVIKGEKGAYTGQDGAWQSAQVCTSAPVA